MQSNPYPMYQPMYGNPYRQPTQNYYPQPVQQPVQPQLQQSAPVTLVTSRAQAELAQIPFDGLPYFFFNTASREIYMKQYDGSTGKCPLVDYQPPSQAMEPPTAYATVEMVAALEGKINSLAALIVPTEQTPTPGSTGRHARKEAAE